MRRRGGLSTLTCTTIRLVRQLASFNVCFPFNSVSFFEGRVAGGSVNFKKTLLKASHNKDMYSKLDVYQETVICILHLSSFCILMLCILCGEGKTLFLRFNPPPLFFWNAPVSKYKYAFDIKSSHDPKGNLYRRLYCYLTLKTELTLILCTLTHICIFSIPFSMYYL